PLLFTHQNAYWDPRPRTWGERPSYPGELPRLAEFIEEYPEMGRDFADVVGRRLDSAYMEEVFEPAIAFAKRTGRAIYCGEFGVADWIEPTSRIAWLRDVLAILRREGFGFGI